MSHPYNQEANTRRCRMFVLLGVADTKRGICVHKAGDLCAQSGGFVDDTPMGKALMHLWVRYRKLLNGNGHPFTTHKVYVHPQLCDITETL